jgi:Prokaryotic E2 family E
MGPIDLHVQRLLARVPEATAREVQGHGTLISIPGIALVAGWNKPVTHVHFLAPQGYPFAKPDCFWADQDLRLASGALPQNTQQGNPMPGLPQAGRWFSWHVDQWNASRDDLLSWLASIRARLAKVT